MKLRFNRRYPYCGEVFFQDHVYDVSEEKGFAMRWLKRGCQKVGEEYKGEISWNKHCLGNGPIKSLEYESESIENEIIDSVEEDVRDMLADTTDFSQEKIEEVIDKVEDAIENVAEEVAEEVVLADGKDLKDVAKDDKKSNTKKRQVRKPKAKK